MDESLRRRIAMRTLLRALHAGILVFAAGVAVAAEPVPVPVPVPVPGGGWFPPPTPAPVPKLPGSGAPLGKALGPPVTPATVAYGFRTRLSSAALCQRFVTQADVVFLDERFGFDAGDPTGIRTPVHTVKGYCPRPLDDRVLSFGGGTRDRTADLLHAMQALSQLSYTPTRERAL
jgi:hypothetical protein